MDIGLVYMRARYYLPGVGRFVSSDTIIPDSSRPQSFNRYSYALNNPINHIDVDGHDPHWCGGSASCMQNYNVSMANTGAVPSEQAALTVDIQKEYSDWIEGTYSGCFMCHAAKGTSYTSLTNSELLLVKNQMEVAAFQGAVAMVTGAAIGTGAGYFACVNDGDCTNELQGVWKLNPFERGVKIENALGRSPELTQNFPVIDRFNNGVATSIKSIDLGANSYQNISTLNRTITHYVNQLSNWQGASWGGVTIRSNDIVTRQLLIAIPRGASQSQIDALLQLQQWATSQGVTLTTVIVP